MLCSSSTTRNTVIVIVDWLLISILSLGSLLLRSFFLVDLNLLLLLESRGELSHGGVFTLFDFAVIVVPLVAARAPDPSLTIHVRVLGLVRVHLDAVVTVLFVFVQLVAGIAEVGVDVARAHLDPHRV